jgi:hypothetical protein
LSLPEFIAWLEDLLDYVDDEDEKNVTVRFDSETSYDWHKPTLEISYYREETPQEILEREARERQRLEENRQKELRLLASLQEKYRDKL